MLNSIGVLRRCQEEIATFIISDSHSTPDRQIDAKPFTGEIDLRARIKCHYIFPESLLVIYFVTAWMYFQAFVFEYWLQQQIVFAGCFALTHSKTEIQFDFLIGKWHITIKIHKYKHSSQMISFRCKQQNCWLAKDSKWNKQKREENENPFESGFSTEQISLWNRRNANWNQQSRKHSQPPAQRWTDGDDIVWKWYCPLVLLLLLIVLIISIRSKLNGKTQSADENFD